MTRVFYVLCATVVALTALALPALAQGTPPADETILTVSGFGRVEREPDRLDVSIGIIAEESTASAAQERAERTMSKAREAVEKLGLPDLDLRTGRVQLYPRYERRQSGDETPKIASYRASITLRVRTSNVNAASKITDAALDAGANRIEGVDFSIADMTDVREEAIRLAGRAATRKAQALAESLDLRLGRVLSASADAPLSPPASGSRVPRDARALEATTFAAADAASSAIVPGKIEVTATVTAAYAAASVR